MNTPLTHRPDGNGASAEAVPAVPAAAGVSDGAAYAQPQQEPRHRRDPSLGPPPRLAALLQERPPLRQRGRVTADRVRRPQVPVRLQPLLNRPDRRIRRIDPVQVRSPSAGRTARQ